MSTGELDELRHRMGERLRAARDYVGYSQDEVAKVLNLSRSAVTNMESGHRKVESLELERLARLYGCTIAYLLEGSKSEDAGAKLEFAARALQGLSERDLDEVLRFASYLRNSGRSAG